MSKIAAYRQQLIALAPRGAAWPVELGSSLNALLDGLAVELARVDDRGDDLMGQADPRIVTEMLTDWEKAWGLPDGCLVADPTEAGRRMALHQRVVSLGGQSAEYYVGMSALLGYEAETEEFRPTRLPFPIPAPVLGRPWAFAWRVAVYGPIALDGPPSYASADLECVIDRIKPGHTMVSFDYAPDPEPLFHFDFLNP